MYAKMQSQKQNRAVGSAARSIPAPGRPLVSASLQSPVSAEDFRRLQQTVGNRVIQRMLAGNDADTQPIQAMRQELGTDQGNGIILRQNRPVAELYMGQGLVAHLGRIILYSKEFSSCSPIVMFNSHTQIGGLFHFPAKGLQGSEPEQADNLRKMYEQVGPTEIHLNNRYKESLRMFPGQSRRECNAEADSIRQYFTNVLRFGGPVRIIERVGSEYTVTLADDQTNVVIASLLEITTHDPSLSVACDRSEEERARIDAAWADAPATIKFGRDDWNYMF
jgi:hypothetical protein